MGFHAVKASEQQSVEIGIADAKRAGEQKAVQNRPTFAARIEETVVCVENQHRYGQLYADFLRARKTVFIDQKAWDLPQTDGMEFDQYDTPQSRSVVIHEYGRVLAGVRLLPTTAQCGCYSYMLKDAQRGLLPNIPEYILYEAAPVAAHVWEATRLFVTRNEPAERRLIIQTKLIKAMATAATEQGATHVIGIVPAAFQRWMNRLGLSALPVGPKLNISGDHIQAAVMYVAGQL
ncbi:MAG: acyl-homoserine-lactone synthase [Sulfitobacter sp.]|uniref:acyl-homoserine-lactone synthase n=1 Tax=Sulfitobacter sp. TaxID=1903071 RepID=UPI0040583E55